MTTETLTDEQIDALTDAELSKMFGVTMQPRHWANVVAMPMWHFGKRCECGRFCRSENIER